MKHLGCASTLPTGTVSSCLKDHEFLPQDPLGNFVSQDWTTHSQVPTEGVSEVAGNREAVSLEISAGGPFNSRGASGGLVPGPRYDSTPIVGGITSPPRLSPAFS